jgi:plastocyanin
MTACPANFRQPGQMATEVGAANRGGGTAPLVNKLEVTLNTPGTHTYACEIGSHCTAGQVSLG